MVDSLRKDNEELGDKLTSAEADINRISARKEQADCTSRVSAVVMTAAAMFCFATDFSNLAIDY